MVRLALVILAGYLLGSIPVAVLIGRLHQVDPRETGDRNPGYWNMKETLGRRAAIPVFIGDALKGALAGLVGRVGRGGLPTLQSVLPWSVTPGQSSPASAADVRSWPSAAVSS
jgi:acyl phosphate:glycerol-3-phosphate acyltransferase